MMKSSKSQNPRASVAIVLVVVGGLGGLAPATARASWSFSAAFFQRDCPAGTPLISIPATSGFSNDAACEQIRAFVLADTGGFAWTSGVGGSTVHHSCQMGFTVGSCSGADDLGAGSVFSPLQNGVVSVNPLGPESGQPIFTPHYTASSEIWQAEAALRLQSFPSLNNHASVPSSSVAYANRFARKLSRFCSGNACEPEGHSVGQEP